MNPLDPDGSVADIGAYYYEQGPPPTLTITLTPYNTPISIPASGGTFDFNIAVENHESTTAIFDIWTDATLPNGSTYGPVINISAYSMPGNTIVDRDRTQAVPANAPEGSYFYNAYVGNYPSVVWEEDNFSFVKECPPDGGVPVPKWECWGESFEDISFESALTPEECVLLSAYPNPFNAECNLSINLTTASDVSLNIYDIQGRLVKSLMDGWYSAGIYDVAFNGTELSSGAYFAMMETNNSKQALKLLFIK